MKKYRVFIGYWDDMAIEDNGGMSWDKARDQLNAALAGFKDDDCDCCREDGTEALTRLVAAEPGNFEAEVDGTDYLIVEEATP